MEGGLLIWESWGALGSLGESFATVPKVGETYRENHHNPNQDARTRILAIQGQSPYM